MTDVSTVDAAVSVRDGVPSTMDAVRASGPVRTCIGCRGRGLRSELVRWVLVDGVPTRDERKVLPGRGAWLHDDVKCVELATRRRAMNRALRTPAAR